MYLPRWRKRGKLLLGGLKKATEQGQLIRPPQTADTPIALSFDDTLPFTDAKQLLATYTATQRERWLLLFSAVSISHNPLQRAQWD